MNFSDMFLQLDSCIRCGTCSMVCPVIRELGIARAPILEPILSAFGSRWNIYTCNELTTLCTQCGACKDVCPRDINIPDIITWVRRHSKEEEGELEAVSDMVNSILERGNPFGVSIDKSCPETKGKRLGEEDYIFYPGCATLQYNPEVQGAWKTIAQVFGFSYTTMGERHKCCGAQLFGWGYLDEAKELAEENNRLFSELAEDGATIVTDCPHCLETFSREYPKVLPSFPFRVIHTTEFLKHLFMKEQVIPAEMPGGKNVYYRPCFMQNIYGSNEPGLELANDLVPTENLAGVLCCGAGNSLGIINPEVPQRLSESIIKRAHDADAQTLITACPHCLRHLRAEANDLQVVDVMQVFAQSLKSKTKDNLAKDC